MIDNAIKKLVTYGLEKQLIEKEDIIYVTNQILEVLKIEEYNEPAEEYSDVELEPVLSEILDYAAENGLLENNSVVYRDLFDTKVMNCLLSKPSEIIRKFNALRRRS